MTHPSADHTRSDADAQSPDTRVPESGSDARSSGMSKSMHDGVAVWCDCCSCEAEPYWAELADRQCEVTADLAAARGRPHRDE